jgi:hypothetical protein
VQPTEGTIAGATVAQPMYEIPQTGGSGDYPSGNEVNALIPKFQRRGSKAVSKWATAVNVLRH